MTIDSKFCISCGKPLTPDDNKDYCSFCTRPDGSMKSYEEVADGMVGFLMKSKNLSQADAQDAANAALAKLPAWQDR